MALLGQQPSLTLLRLHIHVDRAHFSRIDVEHQSNRIASDLRHLIEVPRLREDAPERGNRYRPPVARSHDFDAMSQGAHIRFHSSTILPASARMPRGDHLARQDGRLDVGSVLGPPGPAHPRSRIPKWSCSTPAGLAEVRGPSIDSGFGFLQSLVDPSELGSFPEDHALHRRIVLFDRFP